MVRREPGPGDLLNRAGVVGDPAGHSLSPAIHRDGYATVGLDWDYQAYTVPADEFAGFVRARRHDPEWVGLSVTAPHKEAAVAFGEPDEPTRLLGVGNTLVFGDRPTVHNTDVPGFVRAWRAHDLVAPNRAAVVGNGATARSIVLALAGLGAREVVILARVPERASGVLALAETLGLTAHVLPLGTDPGAVDLVANTVPAAATAPHAEQLADRTRAVFDVVYDPWPTPLGAAAERAGRIGLNGLDLLAGQAVDQFFLFTGQRITFERARSAAGRALAER
ncbi:MAG: shikimate dehydrogenase [Arachnia sp.]